MTQKIRYAKAGDRLSARYLNRVVDGANLALDLLGPARSTRLPSSDSYTPPLDAAGDGTLDGIGTAIYDEQYRRVSLVTITDADTGSSVVVERIDEVTLASSSEVMTLIFNND